MKKVLALIAAAGLLAACSASTRPTAKTVPATSAAVSAGFDVKATLALIGPYSTGANTGAACAGIKTPQQDFAAVSSGAVVSVIGDSGDVVATGKLGAGVPSSTDEQTCAFPVSISNIPAGKGYYSLRVGDQTTGKYVESDFRSMAIYRLGDLTGALVPTAPTTSALDMTGRAACQALTLQKTLTAAEGFVIVAGVTQPGDIQPTLDGLTAVQSESPSDLAADLQRLLEPLQELSDAVDAQHGDTVDTSAVQPAVKSIVAWCSSHHFAVPTGTM